MRYRFGFVGAFLSWQLFAVCLSAAALEAPDLAQKYKLAEDRNNYDAATESIRRSGWKDYDQLRSGLDGYPLAVYLDYYKLTGQPARVRPGEALRFIDLSQDTPLANRFLAVYLNRAGKDRAGPIFCRLCQTSPIVSS